MFSPEFYLCVCLCVFTPVVDGVFVMSLYISLYPTPIQVS